MLIIIFNKSTVFLTFFYSFSDKKMIKIEIPRIPTMYTGSGDLFAALLLAHTYLEDNSKAAFEKTINTLFQVLQITYKHSLSK